MAAYDDGPLFRSTIVMQAGTAMAAAEYRYFKLPVAAVRANAARAALHGRSFRPANAVV